MNIFPATGILGPRQVGKTTLARQIANKKEYLDLENPVGRTNCCPFKG